MIDKTQFEKSFYGLYQGNIEEGLKNSNINNYIILTDKLLVIYTPKDFDIKTLNEINQITWIRPSLPMGLLSQVTESIVDGQRPGVVSGSIKFQENQNISATGKGVLIAIIDSGINYLHPDFIYKDNNTKIVSIWDQSSEKGSPPDKYLFGEEIRREKINEAIKNKDNTLTKDEIGTGTMLAGISAGLGNVDRENRGVAIDSELIIVKLRQYKDVYTKESISYQLADFLAAVMYAIEVAKKENKYLVINVSVGAKCAAFSRTTFLESMLGYRKGVLMISGAGNEGNTDIHFTQQFSTQNQTIDTIVQIGEQEYIDINIYSMMPDKLQALVISPAGDKTELAVYKPGNNFYSGTLNIEEVDWTIENVYPWLTSGGTFIDIKLYKVKPGIWTIRVISDYVVDGKYHIYLPNKNLMSQETRFQDSTSLTTVTLVGTDNQVITVGAYNNNTNNIWRGSSRGPVNKNIIKPDICAPGVDIIGPYSENLYNTATGTGVASSITSGIVSLLIEYCLKQENGENALYTEPMKTYLMLGADKKDIYTYPNVSEGYGLLNIERTIKEISLSL